MTPPIPYIQGEMRAFYDVTPVQKRNNILARACPVPGQLRTVLITTALILPLNRAQPATYLPNRFLKSPCINLVCAYVGAQITKVAARRATHKNTKQKASDRKKNAPPCSSLPNKTPPSLANTGDKNEANGGFSHFHALLRSPCPLG